MNTGATLTMTCSGKGRAPRGWRRFFGTVLLVYLLVCAAAGMVITELTFHPLRRALPEQVAAHPESYFTNSATREVQLAASDQAVMSGWYVKPRNDNGSVVVMLHGLSDNRLGVAGYGGIFTAAGYRLLLPDSRAHGESGGRIATFGLLESDDVHRWVDWLYANDAPRCVYGFGESMGAAIILQSAAREPRFCAIVAESTFATFHEAAYERIGEYFGMGPHWFGRTLGRPIIWAASLYSRLRYGRDLMKANPLEAMRRSRVPVLLIHGASDSNLLAVNSEQIARAAPDHVQLWLVAGAEHTGAYATQPEEFEKRVVGWFAAHPSCGGC